MACSLHTADPKTLGIFWSEPNPTTKGRKGKRDQGWTRESPVQPLPHQKLQILPETQRAVIHGETQCHCLSCKDCGMHYVGQTKNRLMDRFQAHFYNIAYNKTKVKLVNISTNQTTKVWKM